MTPGQTGEAGLLDIAWTPADNTGRPAVTEYKVRYKLASDTEWTDSSHYLPGSHEPAFFLQSLDTGAGYDVQMRAVNIDGDGPWSETATGSASNGFEDVAIWSATMTAGVQPVGGGGPRPFTRYGYVSNGAHGGLSSNAFSYNGQSYTVNDLYHSSANAFVPAHPTFNLSNALGGKLALVFRADGETHVLRFNGVTMSSAGGYDLTSSRTDWPGLPQWAAGTKVIVALVLAPELSVAAVNDPITEGASAEFAMTASRAPIVDLPVTLNIAAAGEYGVDTGNKDLVIPAGQTSAIYNAATTGNDVDAEDGTVTATLVGSVNYNVAASNTAQVMVNDNDSLSYEIWSAMLNSGELTDEDGTITGYFSGFVGSRYGALTPNTFDFRGATYTVDALSASGGNVTFTLNRGLGAGTFVLTVDGAACTFPGSSSGTYTCPGSIRTAAGIPVTLHQLQGPPVFGEGDTATRIIEENVGAEQSAAAAIVGPVSATDPNPGQTVTYALGGADAASFTLNANNGQLSTKAGVNYDYEAKPSYAVTVTATDDSGNDGNDDNSDSIDVTINLNDVLEPPLAPGQPTVAAQGETILSATVTPPDNTGRPSITGYQAQYRVNGSGDSFTVSDDESATPAFDISNLQANTEYEVQVRAVNADGNGAWSASGTGSTRGSTSGAAAEITITAGASPVTEADGAEVTFILTANAPAPVGGLSIAVGITTSGGDYVVTESMVLVAIAGGQTQGTHTIPIVNDNVDEPDGTVTATLVADVANPATYTLGSANTATVTVNDDEATPAVTLVLSPVAMIEFGGFTVVTAAMDPASSEETTIVLQEFMTAADGTLRVVYPTAEADRTLTIPAGATASSGDGVRVGTGDTDDALPHTSTPVTAETVTNTQGVTGPGPVTLRILDRETLNFRLVLSESTLRETDDLGTPGVNEAVVTVTASLDETLSEDVVVVVNPVPKDDRYELSANATLTIAAGSTVSTGDVTISSVNDDAHRSNLELDVRGEVMSNGGVGGLTLPPVTLTIENDDAANTNTPPTASIDASQETSANPNEIVYLSGVGSDTETVTAELTFAWTQTGGTPTVTLNLADAATANFTAPTVTSDTDLTFRLTVTDEGSLTDTAETTIAIKAPAAQGGNAIWEAELTVGQFGRSNAFSGYQQGQAGALSDYDFTVGGTDFTVGAVFLLPSSNFLSFVLSPSATPLPGSFILYVDDVPYPTDDAQFNTQYNFPDQGLTWNLGQVVRLRLERAGPILLWKGTLSAGEGSQFGNRSVGYTLRFQSGTGGPFGELIPDPNVDPIDFEYRGQAIEIAYIFEAKRGAGALWTQLSNAHQLAGGVVDLVVGEEPNERRFSWTIADTVAGNGISGFVATTGQPQSMDDWTRLNWADGQQIPMRLELATEPDSRPEPPGESGPGICDRSLVVQNAILSQFETNPEYAGITDCADVTAEHLEIIQEIDLSGLGLSELMEHDFWDLVHLESLDLSHNSLTLPPNFGIETRPDGEEHEVVGVVLNLRILNISNNDLQEPPLLLGTNLEELDLSHNPALGGDPSNQATPPLLLSDHADLRILNLTNTGLTETPDLNGLVKLEEVYLDGNRLTAVPSVEAMKSLTELRVLHLNDNQITGTMPNVVGNTKLEDLRLQNNRLSGTNGLGSNGALKTLYLHDNEFTSAPNFIQDIRSAPWSTCGCRTTG